MHVNQNLGHFDVSRIGRFGFFLQNKMCSFLKQGVYYPRWPFYFMKRS